MESFPQQLQQKGKFLLNQSDIPEGQGKRGHMESPSQTQTAAGSEELLVPPDGLWRKRIKSFQGKKKKELKCLEWCENSAPLQGFIELINWFQWTYSTCHVSRISGLHTPWWDRAPMSPEEFKIFKIIIDAFRTLGIISAWALKHFQGFLAAKFLFIFPHLREIL